MNQEICAICKEAECNFETRCGHFFHYKCLRGVFDKCTEMHCHYCKEPVPADGPYIEKYPPFGWPNIENCPRLVFHGKCSEKWDKLFSNHKCPQCGQGISDNAKIERVIKDPELLNDTDISNHELDSWVKYAVKEADLSFFEMLCTRRVYSDFYFALKLSAECGRLDLVKHLVEHGLDVSWGNYAALESSLEHGQLDVYKYLIERIGFTPKRLYEQVALSNCAQKGHLEMVKYVIEQGGENVHDKEKSALEAACIGGHIEIVKYLLERGAHTLGRYNRLLIYSASYGHLSLVKYFVSLGADPHVGYNFRNTFAAEREYPLIISAVRGSLDVVKYLVEECGADIHAEGDMALQKATKFGHTEIVQYLTELSNNQ